MAKFLNFYPQYRLADLAQMSPEEYHFLLGGMMDLIAPELTDPLEELVQKRMREKMKQRGAVPGRRR